MKRLLILANNDVGLYNFRKELIDRLVKEDYIIYISLPNGNKVKDLIKNGCNFIDTNVDRRGTNPIKDLKLFFKYLKILKQVKPDVVLTYTIKPNLYGGIACRIKKIPYIGNVTGLGSSVENNGIVNKIIMKLYKIAFKKIRCVFCQNQENLDFLLNKGISKDKLKLIPGSGVNLEKFKLLDYPTDETIEFLFIGRIMKEKGIDEYLETAEHIKQKYPNTVFHVLGFCEEKYQNRLHELQDKDIIKYHGMQDDIIPFIEKSHCTILPSYHEGMANVLLESAASGRPVIASNISGCNEIIDDGKNGYIVQKENSKDLIEKVEKFINLSNEQKKKMGIEGRKKIEKEFNREIIINAYMHEINIIQKGRK